MGLVRTALLVALAALVAPATAPLGAASHAPTGTDLDVETTQVGPANTTWRGLAFDGDAAILAGAQGTEDGTRDVLARWTPETGLEVLYDRPGAGLVDVSVSENGTHLAVGLHETILRGEPGDYRNLWNESRFGGEDQAFTFYGLAGAFRPGGADAVVAGSSLLRVTANGSLETLQSGEDAFFRSVGFQPDGSEAFVSAAVAHAGRGSCQGEGTVFGTVWRTDGRSTLTDDDQETVYGRSNIGCGLVNALSFAPNGTFALLSGRDGEGASFLTWGPARGGAQESPWRYHEATKDRGALTCAAWHPSGRYAVTAGASRDVVGLFDERAWTPIAHAGEDLHGCAMHPDGDYALLAGANGTLARLPHGEGPVPVVAQPDAGSLIPPSEEQTFLVDVIDRGGGANLDVQGTVAGTNVSAEGIRVGPAWALDVNASALSDGRHALVVNATSSEGHATVRHAFLLNNERFRPDTPRILEPSGLEGQGTDTDGRFTIHWEPLETPVVYEVLEQREGGGVNATRVLDAGDATNRTVLADENGTYTYSVRAVNHYNESAWSENVVVNVVLGDGGHHDAGDDERRCPDPTSDLGWPECVLGTDDGDEGPAANDSNGNQSPPEPDSTVPGPGAVGLAAALAGVAVALRARRR